MIPTRRRTRSLSGPHHSPASRLLHRAPAGASSLAKQPQAIRRQAGSYTARPGGA
ncbi:hypothetical protein ppKF707_0211 [Metapseudomonas furukawaii]|uniref:Uncharacterized protein n=1 Tax=Metapseudomonas furukawaii TaxID=1149133 RepID=A0AAD1FE30_METFU|nr:hypothetical protein ppKF707_0211 [Pseudomonas furukawaii]BAU72552.1 hypothetical protein KF707C_8640 [Pseudomonas furukawaii]